MITPSDCLALRPQMLKTSGNDVRLIPLIPYDHALRLSYATATDAQYLALT